MKKYPSSVQGNQAGKPASAIKVEEKNRKPGLQTANRQHLDIK